MFPCRAPGGLCGLESEICECPMVTVFWDLPAEPLDPKRVDLGQSLNPLCKRCRAMRDHRSGQWTTISDLSIYIREGGVTGRC